MKRHTAENTSHKLIRLFDYLAQVKAYNSKDTLQKCPFIKPAQLQNMRVRLYEALLSSLRMYHNGASPEISIYQILINHDILIKKGLYEQAWKLLLKAEHLARTNEFFPLMENIFDRQEYLATIRLKHKNVKQISSQIQKSRNDLIIQRMDFDYLKLKRSELYAIFKVAGRCLRTRAECEAVQEIIEGIHARFEEIENYSEKTRFNLIYSLSLAYRMIGDINQAIYYLNQVQEVSYDPREHQKLLNASVILCNVVGDYEGAQSFIQRIRQSAENMDNDHEHQLLIFENAFFQEIEAHLHQTNYQNALTLIEANEDKLNTYKKQLHTVNQQSKFYRIALVYFGMGQYRTALRWVNQIINFDEIGYRKDIQSSVLLLNLMLHFELKNYDLLVNRIQTTRNFLKKIGRFLEPEKSLMQTLSQIIDKRLDEATAFEKLAQHLRENQQKNPLDHYAMAYLNLADWAFKKSQSKPISS